MSSTLEKLVETNQAMINQNSEIKLLKDENEKLNNKVVHLESEQQKIQTKLQTIEKKTIMCNVIMRGVTESRFEKEYVTRDKVYTESSYLIDTNMECQRDDIARRMSIKQCWQIEKIQWRKELPNFYWISSERGHGLCLGK